MHGRRRTLDAATKDSMATSRQRRRSAFREEFYASGARVPASRDVNKERRHVEYRRRRKTASFWVVAGVLGITFCMIAVGGSAGMIYLREIADFFGVHWVGD